MIYLLDFQCGLIVNARMTNASVTKTADTFEDVKKYCVEGDDGLREREKGSWEKQLRVKTSSSCRDSLILTRNVRNDQHIQLLDIRHRLMTNPRN